MPGAPRDPQRHGFQLVEEALQISASDLICRWDEELSSKEEAQIRKWTQRRCSGEPFQYIVGHEWFWESCFAVGPGVFIPRPETEMLVELVLKNSGTQCRVAELGAGSGNIGISVLQQRPDWQWLAWEKNSASLPYLRENISSLLPSRAKYQLFVGDFFEGVLSLGEFDLLVTNPPYVASLSQEQLSPEVCCEPELALFGGEDGFSILEKLVCIAPHCLKSGGVFLAEIDPNHSDRVVEAMRKVGFCEIQIYQDVIGLDRVVSGRRVHG